MSLLQLLLLLLPALLVAFPLDDEEGSSFMPLKIHHERSHPSSFVGTPKVSPMSFLSSPFVRRGKGGASKPFYQGMLGMGPRDHMKEGANQRKTMWENAIKKETPRSQPDQVLPIGHDALKRSRCNALPFIQNVFRKGCSSLRIPNNFCFGQCNSFYVPGWPVGLSQPCTSCAPVRSRRISVPLHCRGGHVAWEEVVLVEECGCETRYERDAARAGSGEGLMPFF